jgi:TPR repeat protein
MSADQGYSNSEKKLGFFYANGIGCERDLEKALYYYQIASDKGNVRAMNNLASHYNLGLGVERNDAKAIELLIKSAEGGCKEAMIRLVGCYSEGDMGSKVDLKKAGMWSRRAFQPE